MHQPRLLTIEVYEPSKPRILITVIIYPTVMIRYEKHNPAPGDL